MPEHLSSGIPTKNERLFAASAHFPFLGSKNSFPNQNWSTGSIIDMPDRVGGGD